MNIIEQAAKRMDELRRSGVEVPWGAVGVEDPAKAKPVTVASPASPAPVDAVDTRKAAAAAAAEAAAEALDPVESKPQRRSKEVALDFVRLQEGGYLVPGPERSLLEEEFRIVKRPLIKNATGESAAPVSRGNLIMVTSALPGEGKTFSAINLAMSIAMELDHTVLLVDADVVRPAVLNRLGLPPARGLLDVLTGKVDDLSEVMLKTNIPKLTILPAGTANSRTTELLASGAMDDLLNDLATSYQDRIVIFDAPPLLPSTESRVLATRMGQVVVIVEADTTPVDSVKQAFATLEACPVVLSVLNKCRGKVANTAYGYYAV